MKKKLKLITKGVVYLFFAISWGYFLLTFIELKKDINSQVDNIDDIYYKLSDIETKLKYNYSSSDFGDYETIEHYRYNTETEKVEKRTDFGGWSSFNVNN